MWFVAIHAGAGRHGFSTASINQGNSCLKEALEAAKVVLSSGGDAIGAAEQAVIVLENHSYTNAGSNGPNVNLTMDGRVETDASIVCGATNKIGCCGALVGVRNPIKLATHLLRQQSSKNVERQSPCFLVGNSARKAAQAANIGIIDYDQEPIHEEARKKHEKKAVAYALDTVGVICIDVHGNTAAGVSSAGIALKEPGRVGHAGSPHMGCCAGTNINKFAFSASGRGEHLIQSMLIQHIRHVVSSHVESPQHAMRDAFEKATIQNGDSKIEGGTIGFIVRNEDENGRKKRKCKELCLDFIVAFTTPSIAIGMCSSHDTSPHTQIMRSTALDAVTVQSICSTNPTHSSVVPIASNGPYSTSLIDSKEIALGMLGLDFSTASLLPWGLLALYFIQSFLQSFPMTAYGDWLFNEIHMSPATTNFYYALTFFPWNLKPVYALISDNFPIFGYRRKYYIALCEIGSALAVLATGLYVRSVAGAFAVKLIDSSCEAFTQMMLGVVLVDVASGDRQKSGNVQAWANASKNTACIVALIVGIPIYANKSITSREVIAWTSCIPLVGIFVAIYYFNDIKVDSTLVEEIPSGPKTCNELVHQKWTGFRAACVRIFSEQRSYIPVMIFFFLSSALPGGGSMWYQYTYSLLNDQKECMQYMSLAGMVGRVISCMAYANICNGYSIRTVFAISTILTTVASLPQILLAPPMAQLPISVCTFCSIESFVTAFAGEFALLQLLIVATFYCPTKASDGKGLTYALYLSFMDFGGVVSSFVSAIVINALGITEDPTTFIINWANLSWLVIIGAICKLAILAFLCLLPSRIDSSQEEKQPLVSMDDEET